MVAKNVVLTGFMATGKSSIGRLLAARIGYEWVDTDALIEKRHGPIPQLFATRGENVFRQLERDLARELAQHHGLVISTGGRMMLDPQTEAVLGADSRVYCLTAPTEEIQRRAEAAGEPDRPLLETENVAERIDALLAERAEGYARFEQVPTENRTPEAVVEDIVSRLRIDP